MVDGKNNEGMDAFFTREKANSGINVPLFHPDGTESEHFIQIRSVYSDAFRNVRTSNDVEVMRIAAIESDDDRAVEIDAKKREMIAELVISWSFDLECTQANVIKFLKEAPQISDQIDQVSVKGALFFGKKSSNLKPSQNQSSNSIESQKDQSLLTDST